MSTTFIIVALTLFLIGFWIHLSQKPRRDAVKNINGPYNIPLLGALYLSYGLTPQNIFEKAMELGLKYGLILKVWVLNRLVVASADPELNEQLLTSTTHITKHHLYGVLHEWLGNGLLTSDGRKWHTRRRIITPAFHFKILEEFVEIFNHHSKTLVECLAAKADGKTAFDVYPFVCAHTLDIIAETAMGTKVNAQTGGTKEYTNAVLEMTKTVAWRFLRVHLHSDLIFSLLHPFKRMRSVKNLRIMHDFTHKVIKERRDALEASLKKRNLNGADDSEDMGTKKRMALLDVLLQSTIDGEPLTNEDIREEVDTFMFEGHDTTATSLACSLYILARNPRVQDKLLAEINEVYGADFSKPITMMSLNDLKYMECVIKESLRQFAPVPLIARNLTEDFKYKHSVLGEGIIPAGTEFIVTVFGMGYDYNAFDEPLDFIPERHINPNLKSSFQFIPFSAGPRNCIGQKFAMYEMKVTLIHVIRSYELLPMGKDFVPELGIVLRSATGMQVGLRKRKV
ncbi:cytochrome P450 4d8-like [Musca autumnalis]|uniref:cytochrome P450 4d8-like n=1 Tax=Musca autumnalis TaxID=221902 RepID=UPI003CE82183